MRVTVKFRLNKATGQVEVFEIDDLQSTLPEAEHNREHDRIAAEIGNLVERNPRVVEVLPGAGVVAPGRGIVEDEGRSVREGRERRAEP
jgi:hypothetical protein